MPMVNTDHDARDLEMEEEEEDQFPNSFRFCCYREMELLEFREKLVFRSQDHHDSSTTRPSFSISRSDGAIESCSGSFLFIINLEFGIYRNERIGNLESEFFFACLQEILSLEQPLNVPSFMELSE